MGIYLLTATACGMENIKQQEETQGNFDNYFLAVANLNKKKSILFQLAPLTSRHLL